MNQQTNIFVVVVTQRLEIASQLCRLKGGSVSPHYRAASQAMTKRTRSGKRSPGKLIFLFRRYIAIARENSERRTMV
jgi:hypothetical protein